MRLQRFVAESGADFADRLVLLRIRVVAREQERAVDVRTLALAVVRADDDEVERVANAREVILLELRTHRETGLRWEQSSRGRAHLEPIDSSPARLIVAQLALEHLHHEAFAAVLDALFQERLDLICRLAVRRRRELELPSHGMEVRLQQFAARGEVLLQ